MTRTWNTRATSVRSALFLLLGVCVGGFVGMEVLGCGKQVLGVLAAKTTIERVREFGVLIHGSNKWGFDFDPRF